MRNVMYILILALVTVLAGCDSASQEAALPTPKPTEEPLHCSPDDKPLIIEQVAYRGMLAGRTTFDEVNALFGEPTDNIGSTYWFENEDPVFWITFEDELVDEIQMLGDFSLQDLIISYGCPDILTHIKSNNVGDMTHIEWVDLVYLNAGIDFVYPSSLSFGVDVENIIYFPPMGEEEFFERNPSLEVENPMTWDMLYVHCQIHMEIALLPSFVIWFTRRDLWNIS